MGKKVKGGLVARGGVWYARWVADGKGHLVSTGERVGVDGAKDRARKILAEKVRPFQIKDGADREAAFARRVLDAERKAEDASAALAPTVLVKDAWAKGPYEWSQPTRSRKTIRKLSPRNIHENECAWGRFSRWIRERRGDEVAMADVTEEDAQAWADSLVAEGLTPSRHNLLLLVANVMYRIAGIPSPFAAVPKLTKQEPEHREAFTRSQVKRLLSAAEGEWRGFLAVLYYTGLRVGDAALLKAECRRADRMKTRTIKTGARIDQLENPELTAILQDVAGDVKQGFLFSALAADYSRNPAGISQRFSRFAAKVLAEEDGAKFDGTEPRPGGGRRRVSRWGLHSFRHSFASHAAEKGVPLPIVQRYLGHATATITQIYAMHASDEAARALVKAVSLDDDT